MTEKICRSVIVTGGNKLTNEIVTRLASWQLKLDCVYLIAPSQPELVSKFDVDNVLRGDFIGKSRAEAVKAFLEQEAQANGVKIVKICKSLQKMTASDWSELVEEGGVLVNTEYDGNQRRLVHKASTMNHIPVIDVAVEREMFSVFVTVPFVTEQFYKQSDISSKADFPQCVIKTFPTEIEHCVTWAMDKFVGMFRTKPTKVTSIEEAVATARKLCTKYFDHKARQLLISLPCDHRSSDGQLFWSTRKCPSPFEFSIDDPHCDLFVHCTAELLCKASNISFAEATPETIRKIALTTQVEPFIAKQDKVVSIDETTKRQVSAEGEIGGDSGFSRLTMDSSLSDETQLGFLASTTNLRAKMYGIEPIALESVRDIVLDVTPCDMKAIKQAAEYALIELEKLIDQPDCKSSQIDSNEPKNYFGNVLDGRVDWVTVDTVPATVRKLGPLAFSEWDHWDFQEKKDEQLTLEQLLEQVKGMASGLECSMIVMRDAKPSRTLYMDMLPAHVKRRKQTIQDLVGEDVVAKNDFVALDLFFDFEDNSDLGPPLKYHFGK